MFEEEAPESFFSKSWNRFKKLDTFVKFYFLTMVLIVLAVPIMVAQKTNFFSKAANPPAIIPTYAYDTVPSPVQLGQITEIIWGYVQPDPNTMQFSVNGNTDVIDSMCSTDLPCSFQLYTDYGSNASQYNRVFSDSSVRTALFNQITSFFAAHPQFDGVNFDWECDNQGTDPAQITNFYKELYALLNPLGKFITATENYGSVTMTTEAQNYLKWIGLMTYDVAPVWYGNLENVTTDMTRWSGAGFSKSKLIAGINFAALYGGSWSNSHTSYGSISDNASWTADSNEINGYQFNGYNLVKSKAQWIKDQGYAGAFLYYLSQDSTNQTKSLARVIYDTLGAGVANPTPAPTLAPSPTPSPSGNRKIVGYLSEWSMANVSNALSSVNLNLITHLSYQSVKVTSGTNPALFSSWGLDDTTNRFKQVVAAGHAKGIPVVINFYNSNSDLSNIVNNSSLLSQLANNLRDYVAQTGADGVDIDWEASEPASEMSKLIIALHNALPSNKLIFVAASWYRNDVELSVQQYVDLINVMTYDMEQPITGCAHSVDPTGYPYHSTFEDSVCVMNMWANAGYSKSKLTMGIPFYGKSGDGTVGLYGQIVDNLNPSSSQNEASVSTFLGQTVTGGKLWWNGPDYVKKKVAWVKANGFGGVMAFDIAEDKLNSSDKSLLQAIYSTLNSSTTAPTSTPTPASVTDTTPPVISNILSSTTQTEATIDWKLNEYGTGQIEYGTTTSYGKASFLESSFSYMSHEQVITGLTSATTYHFRIRSADAAGNLTISSDYTFKTLGTATATPTQIPSPIPTVTTTKAPTSIPPTSTPAPVLSDTTPPVISNIKATTTETTATVNWSLNEYATGQVEYGLTTSYGKTSLFESSFSYMSHEQIISGLISGTTYHYRVRSADAVGNLAISSDYTFKTLGTAPAPLTNPTSTPTNTPTPVPPTPTKIPTATPTKISAPTGTTIPTIAPTRAPIPTPTSAPKPWWYWFASYFGFMKSLGK